MNNLKQRFHDVVTAGALPLAGKGQTAERFYALWEVAREDLSLAKLAEAHWDAVAILAEAGHTVASGVLYGVWASEMPNEVLELKSEEKNYSINGKKMFCSGAGIVDHALITVNTVDNKRLLVDINLKNALPNMFEVSPDPWNTLAFQETQTSTILFKKMCCFPKNIIGKADWYLKRAGFWQGALGPAACWAGGAAGLLDYAKKSSRQDAHTLAHLGAMESSIWTMQCLLKMAGDEIDRYPNDSIHAHNLALKFRHSIEQHCTDTLRRFARTYGPFPLACDAAISRRYQELDLFLRQCHGERDLEQLGKNLFNACRYSSTINA